MLELIKTLQERITRLEASSALGFGNGMNRKRLFPEAFMQPSEDENPTPEPVQEEEPVILDSHERELIEWVQNLVSEQSAAGENEQHLPFRYWRKYRGYERFSTPDFTFDGLVFETQFGNGRFIIYSEDTDDMQSKEFRVYFLYKEEDEFFECAPDELVLGNLEKTCQWLSEKKVNEKDQILFDMDLTWHRLFDTDEPHKHWVSKVGFGTLKGCPQSWIGIWLKTHDPEKCIRISLEEIVSELTYVVYDEKGKVLQYFDEEESLVDWLAEEP